MMSVPLNSKKQSNQSERTTVGIIMVTAKVGVNFDTKVSEGQL